MPEPHGKGRWVTVKGRAVFIAETPKGTVIARPGTTTSKYSRETPEQLSARKRRAAERVDPPGKRTRTVEVGASGPDKARSLVARTLDSRGFPQDATLGDARRIEPGRYRVEVIY